MASAVSENVSGHSECAVCIEQFKEPKVLPCLHTYCKGCLEKLVKKKGPDHVVTCPECRQDTKIADGDICKLQPNFWINNFMTLLSMQEKTTSGKPLPCEHCDSGDPAVSRCTKCSVFLCEFCVTAHRRIIAFKGHQILSMADVQKLGSKALAKPSFCAKHTGETLKLFCETCQETICRDCTIVDHREHKYNFVADVAERERKAVQSSLSETKANELVVAEGLKSVQTMVQCVQSKVSEVNKEVDTFFNEQVKALEYYRANLKHEVTTEGQVRINQLENQSEVLSTFLAQLKSGMEFTNQAIADGDDVKLLALKRQLIQRLTQLNSAKIECKSCQNDYLKLQVHQTIWDMKKMATLRYQPIDPQKCTVSMVGGEEGVMYQTLARQTVELLLINNDEKSEPGGQQVTAQAGFVTEYIRQMETLKVQDNGDGSYSFSFCPKSEGHVTLSVLVEGQHVTGSPFSWNVYPVLPGEEDRNDVKLKAEREIIRHKKQRKKWIKEKEASRVCTGDAYVYREGSLCWKVQLVSFSSDQKYHLQIGLLSRHNFGWYWSYETWKDDPLRSDNEEPSITSVENNDVFTVFLNVRTEKLIIYNNRSKQTEIFTEVQVDKVVPIIMCQLRGIGMDNEVYASLHVPKM